MNIIKCSFRTLAFRRYQKLYEDASSSERTPAELTQQQEACIDPRVAARDDTRVSHNQGSSSLLTTNA